MAPKVKIKYNVTDVESGSFEQPKPGLYTAKVHSCVLEEKPANGKDARLVVVLEVRDKKYKGARLWTYINVISEAAAFKLREFIEAIGAPLKGSDLEKLCKIADGKEVKVKVAGDTYNGEYKANVSKLLAIPDEDDEDDEDEDDDDDEEEVDDDDDSDDDEDEEDEDEDEEDDEEDDEDDSSDDDEEDDDEDEEEDEDEDDDEDDEEDEDEDGDDYDDWDVAALKAEAKTRGLKTAGKKDILIGRLRKDDESDPF